MESLKGLIKSASLDVNIHPKVGEAIINSLFKQFRELSKSADKNSIKNFRIIKLGIFYRNGSN